MTRGGDAVVKRRRTKKELIDDYYRKEGSMSPELGTEVREGADNVQLNIPYEIINVEEVETDVRHYQGVRVELLSPKGHVGSIALWKRPVTGKGSKLGVFITLLGSNTDKWLHKWIIFRGWEQNNRVIELTAAPEGKATKATTVKGVAKAIKSK